MKNVQAARRSMRETISNSNWTEWSTIQGVIARVISKSDEREADLKLRARLIMVIGLSGVQFGL